VTVTIFRRPTGRHAGLGIQGDTYFFSKKCPQSPLKLLARRERQPRRSDSRFKPGGRRQRHTFDDAITMLEKKLLGLCIPIKPFRLEDETA
jgi:hypothetical protein